MQPTLSICRVMPSPTGQDRSRYRYIVVCGARPGENLETAPSKETAMVK
jgi:hypothetical protein